MRERPSLEARQARYESRIAGWKRYTGDPCKRVTGHGRERYTSNAHCVECMAARSLEYWHAIGKTRAKRRQARTPEGQAAIERATYITRGGNYARKRDPADAYPWLAAPELRDGWRRGYARAIGRPGRRPELSLTRDEIRALVSQARQLWLAPGYVDNPHCDLI